MSDQSDIDDDIVKRLREYRTWSHWPPMPLTTAAADEIERLRADNISMSDGMVALCKLHDAEIAGLRAQLASAESQLRLAFFPFRLQARPAEGGDWTDIYPAQLQAFTKGPYDVRAIELPLTSAYRKDES